MVHRQVAASATYCHLYKMIKIDHHKDQSAILYRPFLVLFIGCPQTFFWSHGGHCHIPSSSTPSFVSSHGPTCNRNGFELGPPAEPLPHHRHDHQAEEVSDPPSPRDGKAPVAEAQNDVNNMNSCSEVKWLQNTHTHTITISRQIYQAKKEWHPCMWMNSYTTFTFTWYWFIVHRQISTHGPTKQPHSPGVWWHWVLWWLSVSNLLIYLLDTD